MKRNRHLSMRGFALVVVLAAILLCSIMVIVMLERSATNLRSSHAYSHAVQVRSFSSMAVNRVQAQILEATTTNQTPGTPASQRWTWASQPGAIRTYPANNGTPLIFKLYSSEDMRTTNTSLASDVPDTWHASPREFTDLNEPVSVGGTNRHPILDPAVVALSDGATGISTGFRISGAPVAPGSHANPAPMPVRWIYVLRDGTHCQIGDPRIGDANPLVGRIAFWTDDETAKVNINTAGPVTAESFWDMPRAASRIEEERYAFFQPSQNEYTRYPGHPGMVSLRAVLGNLGGLSPGDYYGLTPRYRWGGSRDGQVRIDATRDSLLLNKEDRPYATTDELLFQGRGRAPNPALGASRLAQLQFFITTSSRAPELNLFGQPRVTIWPIHAQASDTRRTPFDRLIAYCSTIGGKPYYFVREFPLSATRDYEDFERNQQLYAYLQRLTAEPVPGFGSDTFAGKYGADRDQILTAIFDYIRCTNLNDTWRPTASGGVQSYTPDLEQAVNAAVNHTATSPDKGAGFVVPIRIGDTRGGGRFPTVTGGGLWFCSHLEDPKTPAGPTNRRMLSALLLVKTVTPMFGFPLWKPSALQVELQNVPGTPLRLQVGSTTATMFTGGTTAEIFAPPTANYGQGGGTSGGYDGAGWILYHLTLPADSPFLGASVPVSDSDTTFSILPGALDVRLIVQGNVIQSFRLSFPGVSDVPLPEVTEWDSGFNNPISWWKMRTTTRPMAPLDADAFRSIELNHGDARLALMSATTPDDPFDAFTQHPDYPDATKRMAHSFGGISTANNPYLWPGGSAGRYAGLTHYTENLTSTGAGWKAPYRTMTRYFGPNIRPDITDLRSAGWRGDFDNGFSRWVDGPFLNMPDAGARSTSSGAAAAPYLITEGWVRADGLFSPLRQVPSAVMFGSLPTGVKAGIPWRTLLFCPNPPDPAHEGFESPADHLLLDLFRMPVVEPVALSGPASTDGKINMNFQIAPFSYIRRASAWYALLEPMRIFSVPDGKSERYKNNLLIESFDYRSRLNVEETLRQFDARFAANELFRSASEICRIFLIPQGTTLENVANWWETRRLTGDNSREKPYAELYPKLTTQSNTYRVHLRVQLLPPSATEPSPGNDFQPLAEYRGSTLIERYLDPNDPRFATVDPDEDNLNTLYRFRVLEQRQFVP